MKSRLIILGLLLFSIAACQSAAPSSVTPSTTSRFATVVGPIVQKTLPPSWTPSPTPTITPTRTPTLTPSVTPTESPEDICAGFKLLYDFSGQQRYAMDGYIPIILTLDSPSASIHFEAVQRFSGESKGFDLPGGGSISMTFHISALPGPGLYDWTLSARSDSYGDLCTLQGRFLVTVPTATPPPTPSPESTEELETATP